MKYESKLTLVWPLKYRYPYSNLLKTRILSSCLKFEARITYGTVQDKDNLFGNRNKNTTTSRQCYKKIKTKQRHNNDTTCVLFCFHFQHIMNLNNTYF